MSSAEAKNLEAISKAIDQHNRNCDSPAIAVLMNPFEVERLDWKEIRGIPVEPDPEIGTGRFRIVCNGYHGPKQKTKREEAIQINGPLDPSERELVPAGVPDERVS